MPAENDQPDLNSEAEEPAVPAEGAGLSEPAAAGDEEQHDPAAQPSPSPTGDVPVEALVPSASVGPQPPAPPQETGQRRISRHTTTTSTRTETTTEETIVEAIAIAPPVYAAPSGEHPRPVG